MLPRGRGALQKSLHSPLQGINAVTVSPSVIETVHSVLAVESHPLQLLKVALPEVNGAASMMVVSGVIPLSL